MTFAEEQHSCLISVTVSREAKYRRLYSIKTKELEQVAALHSFPHLSEETCAQANETAQLEQSKSNQLLVANTQVSEVCS